MDREDARDGIVTPNPLVSAIDRELGVKDAGSGRVQERLIFLPVIWNSNRIP
jgi:hypothetical protein